MRRRLIAGGAALVVVAVVLVVVLSSGGGRRHGVASSTTTTSSIPPPPPEVTGEQFGVNVNRLFNDRTYTPAQIHAQLAALRATGATVARSDTLWEAVEPSPPSGGVHHYDWRFDDLVAASLAQGGLRWLALLDYSALWARARPDLLHSPPRSPAEFAAFAAAFAGRYGSNGSFWRAHPELPDLPVQIYEVWNEPDNGTFWQPAPNAVAYADLYLATRATVARVDPRASVVVGGLTKPTVFLPEMMAARPQLRSVLDGVAVHPYGPTPGAVLAKIRRDRETLRALGLPSVPLYVTEFGWTIHPAGSLGFAPANVRPRYIETTVSVLGHTNCSIAAVVLYTWVTPQRDASDHEDWYGIHPPQGGGSPATDAFAAGVAGAKKPAAQQPVC